MYLLNLKSFTHIYDVVLFTFHYVSIKSDFEAVTTAVGNVFTFHYVSIKSSKITKSKLIIIVFTFHYVSIKSSLAYLVCTSSKHLHSTMYLLNPIKPDILS